MTDRPVLLETLQKNLRMEYQRGVAVITALLLTTLAITIVASLFWQQQVQVRSIENQRLQLQKQWILRGALDWASLILREDMKHSSVDSLDEPWAVSLAETRLDQYVENGRSGADVADATLSGSIGDAQARYNLNNLSTNGIVNPSEVAVFARLLAQMQLSPSLAQATADLMAVTQGRLELAAAGGVPVPQPIKLTQLDDLLAVPGLAPEMLDRLKDVVLFLPRATPVNVNTASAEVLSALVNTLTPGDAAELVASRNTASFRDITDFTHRLPGKVFSVSAEAASVTSNYFLVAGKVRMSTAELEMQALLERSDGMVKPVWIREF